MKNKFYIESSLIFIIYILHINMIGAKMIEKVEDEKKSTKETKMKRFKEGDLAVYPAHGVGIIESIETKVVNGERHDFYILKVLENGMVIMIPTWNVDSVGLRDIIKEEEIPELYDVIRSDSLESPIENQTWNRRYREYMEKIKTGSLFDVAEVFRDLYLLKLSKDLSFGERKLFDTAQVLLVKELSTAKNTDEKVIISEIETLFTIENLEEDVVNL